MCCVLLYWFVVCLRVVNEWDVSSLLTTFKTSESSFNAAFSGCFPIYSSNPGGVSPAAGTAPTATGGGGGGVQSLRPSAITAMVDAPVSFNFMCQQSMLAQTKMIHLMYQSRLQAQAAAQARSLHSSSHHHHSASHHPHSHSHGHYRSTATTTSLTNALAAARNSAPAITPSAPVSGANSLTSPLSLSALQSSQLSTTPTAAVAASPSIVTTPVNA